MHRSSLESLLSLSELSPNPALERTRLQRAWLPAVVSDQSVAPALLRRWRAAQLERWASGAPGARSHS
jgi:hypothetical protein